jgi:hypothetical protein
MHSVNGMPPATWSASAAASYNGQLGVLEGSLLAPPGLDLDKQFDGVNHVNCMDSKLLESGAGRASSGLYVLSLGAWFHGSSVAKNLTAYSKPLQEKQPPTCDFSTASVDDNNAVEDTQLPQEPPILQPSNETRTTVYIQNLPVCSTRGDLLALMDRLGLSMQYDFVYVPIDFNTGMSRGFAFVNFTNSPAAVHFTAAMDGFTAWHVPSRKVCSVTWSKTQGYDKNVRCQTYKHLIKENIPEEFKPAVFKNGCLIPFPRPGARRNAVA